MSGNQYMDKIRTVGTSMSSAFNKRKAQLSAYSAANPKQTGGFYLVAIATLLFVLATPGFLITLPGAPCPKGCSDSSSAEKAKLDKPQFMSERTSHTAIFVHAILYAIILAGLFTVYKKQIMLICSGGPAAYSAIA